MVQEAAVAASLDNLSLGEVETASTPTIATASASAASTKAEDGASASAQPRKEEMEAEGTEVALEDEKHDFFFDAATDGLTCSIGFCLMTEAVMAMDGFCTRSRLWRSTLLIVQPRGKR